ncbi:exonuclease RNase T and DNA polymerase III domain protein, partial [Escherichia coli EC1848]
ASIGNDDLAA